MPLWKWSLWNVLSHRSIITLMTFLEPHAPFFFDAFSLFLPNGKTLHILIFTFFELLVKTLKEVSPYLQIWYHKTKSVSIVAGTVSQGKQSIGIGLGIYGSSLTLLWASLGGEHFYYEQWTINLFHRKTFSYISETYFPRCGFKISHQLGTQCCTDLIFMQDFR